MKDQGMMMMMVMMIMVRRRRSEMFITTIPVASYSDLTLFFTFKIVGSLQIEITRFFFCMVPFLFVLSRAPHFPSSYTLSSVCFLLVLSLSLFLPSSFQLGLSIPADSSAPNRCKRASNQARGQKRRGGRRQATCLISGSFCDHSFRAHPLLLLFLFPLLCVFSSLPRFSFLQSVLAHRLSLL